VALGQLLAATALMSASLKFKGRLTLQIRLPGAISLLQAETNELGELRAIARYDSDQPEATLTFATEGQLVITLEPEQGQRYQGITAIPQGDIATALEDYFSQSEQLPTR
ncbi:Hsp33 family molecular chaperone HslO, partial [Gilvimarinus sp. 1_MG-2023]